MRPWAARFGAELDWEKLWRDQVFGAKMTETNGKKLLFFRGSVSEAAFGTQSATMGGLFWIRIGPSEREEQSEAGRSSLPTAKAKSRPKSKPKAKAKAKVNQPKKRAQEPKGKAQAKKKSAKRARSKDDVQKRMHSATRLKHLLLFQSLLLKTLF